MSIPTMRPHVWPEGVSSLSQMSEAERLAFMERLVDAMRTYSDAMDEALEAMLRREAELREANTRLTQELNYYKTLASDK